MNPFIQNFKLNVIRVHSHYYETKTSNISEGVVLSHKKVSESFLAEKQEKTHVYNIPYIENILFNELKSSGRDMLLYIMYNIKKDEDCISLSIEKVTKQMNIAKSTYYNAIEQLIDVGIICKKQTTDYWINPFYIFNGNRIEYYHKQCPECIEIVAEVSKKTN